MESPSSLPYRPCVGAAIFNQAGEVFIGDRADRAGDGDAAWQMPQGGIDAGEDPFLAVKREVYEETNMTSLLFLAEAPDWLCYDVPQDLAGPRFRQKWRGQKQKWYAFRFVGAETEIDIHHPAGGAHKPEFVAWRWERLDRLPALIVPFKRPVYEALTQLFADFAG